MGGDYNMHYEMLEIFNTFIIPFLVLYFMLFLILFGKRYLSVFCKTFLHKIAKTFCRSLQLHFVGNCKPGWQSWYLPAI